MAKEIVKDVEREVAPDSVRKGRLVIRYDKSFTARIIQGDDELRANYDALKNELLSYKGVKARVSWKQESFRIGKVLVAALKIRGKHISIYLPLNAADYVDTKYKVDDVSKVKANAETPCAYAIKNGRRSLYAKDLIATVMEAQGAAKLENEPVSFTDELPYDTTDNLIARELIKRVYSKIGAKGKEVALKEVTEEEIEALMAEEGPVEEVVEEPVEEQVEDPVEEQSEEPVQEQEEVVEEPVQEPVAKEPVEEQPAKPVVEKKEKPVKKQPKKVVAVEAGARVMDKTKTDIINLDTLSRHFVAGETVTLDEIKNRVPCFDQQVTYIKVLARGNLDFALTVEADAFSAEAVDKISQAGGKVLRTLR